MRLTPGEIKAVIGDLADVLRSKGLPLGDVTQVKCGQEGCLYPSIIPNRVLKISANPNEAALAQFLQNNQPSYPGFPLIQQVWDLSQFPKISKYQYLKDYPLFLYAILKEDIPDNPQDPRTSLLFVRSSYALNHTTTDLDLEKHWKQFSERDPSVNRQHWLRWKSFLLWCRQNHIYPVDLDDDNLVLRNTGDYVFRDFGAFQFDGSWPEISQLRKNPKLKAWRHNPFKIDRLTSLLVMGTALESPGEMAQARTLVARTIAKLEEEDLLDIIGCYQEALGRVAKIRWPLLAQQYEIVLEYFPQAPSFEQMRTSSKDKIQQIIQGVQFEALDPGLLSPSRDFGRCEYTSNSGKICSRNAEGFADFLQQINLPDLPQIKVCRRHFETLSDLHGLRTAFRAFSSTDVMERALTNLKKVVKERVIKCHLCEKRAEGVFLIKATIPQLFVMCNVCAYRQLPRNKRFEYIEVGPLVQKAKKTKKATPPDYDLDDL